MTTTRGGRRTARLIARAAVIGAAAAACAVVLAAAAPPAAAEVSETLTTTVLNSVTVRSGDAAKISYRADDSAGATVSVDLDMTTREGELVRRLIDGRETPLGVDQTWSGRLRAPAGRYLLVVHAHDANGFTEANAVAAALRILTPPPPLVPTAHARRVAFAWAARRAGRVSVAVVDSRGQLHGFDPRRRFLSASVVKAMLLVAYLRAHPSVGSGMRATLTRMIVVSDNGAADAVYRRVGRRGLERLARVAHLRGFRSASAWIVSRVTAADMARFFRDMEGYLPHRHRRFANRLLSHITASQRWGIPVAAERRGYHVYFKPGWLGAWVLASEAARLERRSVRLGLAVFTDRNPTSSYGKDTIAGVTERLLRR